MIGKISCWKLKVFREDCNQTALIWRLARIVCSLHTLLKKTESKIEMNVKKHDQVLRRLFHLRRGLFSNTKGREAKDKLLKFLAKLFD